MRLIDANALKSKVEGMVEHRVQESDYEYGCNQTLDYVADILIEDAPTIDAEPVVRCKDCSYLDEDEFENGDVVLFCNFMRAELNDMEMNNESYCSNGKRREP